MKNTIATIEMYTDGTYTVNTRNVDNHVGLPRLSTQEALKALNGINAIHFLGSGGELEDIIANNAKSKTWKYMSFTYSLV